MWRRRRRRSEALPVILLFLWDLCRFFLIRAILQKEQQWAKARRQPTAAWSDQTERCSGSPRPRPPADAPAVDGAAHLQIWAMIDSELASSVYRKRIHAVWPLLKDSADSDWGTWPCDQKVHLSGLQLSLTLLLITFVITTSIVCSIKCQAIVKIISQRLEVEFGYYFSQEYIVRFWCRANPSVKWPQMHSSIASVKLNAINMLQVFISCLFQVDY